MTQPDVPRAQAVVPLQGAVQPQELVGGKARALQVLLSAGLPVPDGFVVTTEVFDALAQQLDHAATTKALREAARQGDLRELRRLDLAVAERTTEIVLPAGAQEGIVIGCGDLGVSNGEAPAVVRSSATGEDGARRSFAGLFTSLADRSDAAAVEAAVAIVLASGLSSRVAAYLDRLGESGLIASLKVAALVQRQIEAELSGVVFTRHPIDGGNQMLCEWVPASDPSVVGGGGHPHQVTFARAVDSWEIEGEVGPLDDEVWMRLVDLAECCVELLGGPQDVEWVYERQSGDFRVVQSRPITV